MVFGPGNDVRGRFAFTSSHAKSSMTAVEEADEAEGKARKAKSALKWVCAQMRLQRKKGAQTAAAAGAKEVEEKVHKEDEDKDEKEKEQQEEVQKEAKVQKEDEDKSEDPSKKEVDEKVQQEDEDKDEKEERDKHVSFAAEAEECAEAVKFMVCAKTVTEAVMVFVNERYDQMNERYGQMNEKVIKRSDQLLTLLDACSQDIVHMSGRLTVVEDAMEVEGDLAFEEACGRISSNG